jgi:hypothetical protein
MFNQLKLLAFSVVGAYDGVLLERLPTADEIESTAGIITQLVILVVSLWQIIKGKKKKKD